MQQHLSDTAQITIMAFGTSNLMNGTGSISLGLEHCKKNCRDTKGAVNWYLPLQPHLSHHALTSSPVLPCNPADRLASPQICPFCHPEWLGSDI